MSRRATATFGCGSFWTKRRLFGALHGVTDVRVGYMGGTTLNPTQQQVAQKTTGHTEVVEVTYDPDQTRFPQLLKAFFSFHDATRDRSGKGGQYRSVVFCRKAKEEIIAKRAIELLRREGLEVTTRVESAQIFWEAAPSPQRGTARTLRAADDRDAPSTRLAGLSLVEAARLTPLAAVA